MSHECEPHGNDDGDVGSDGEGDGDGAGDSDGGSDTVTATSSLHQGTTHMLLVVVEDVEDEPVERRGRELPRREAPVQALDHTRAAVVLVERRDELLQHDDATVLSASHAFNIQRHVDVQVHAGVCGSVTVTVANTDADAEHTCAPRHHRDRRRRIEALAVRADAT
jgi:hypothetical protein